MRLALLLAVASAGCLDFDSLPGRFQGDLAVEDQSTDDLSGEDAGGDLAGVCGPSGGIHFVDQTSVTQGQPPETTLHLPVPANVQPCDLLLLQFYADLGAVITDPPGWNKFFDLPSSQNFETRYYWRVATANEPSSYDLVMNPAQFAAANVVAYRGVSAPTPIEGTTESACHSPPTTLPAFTPQSTGARIVTLCTCDTGFGQTPNFSQSPSMMMRSITIATAVWDAPLPASGMAPTEMVTCNTSSELCCLELALVPAT
jgi:hypothetical protein